MAFPWYLSKRIDFFGGSSVAATQGKVDVDGKR